MIGNYVFIIKNSICHSMSMWIADFCHQSGYQWNQPQNKWRGGDKRGAQGNSILTLMGLSVSSTDSILLIVSEMFSMNRVHKANHSQ